MEEDKNIDQTKLAESVSDNINMLFIRDFLVKPLALEKVKKEFSKPVPKDTKTDPNGVEATDYDKVETEIKEVDSDYRKGIVLKVPLDQANAKDNNSYNWGVYDIAIGDTIIYPTKYGRWLDILKDTQLVSTHDILAVIKSKHD